MQSVRSMMGVADASGRYIAEERDNLFNVKYEETSSAYQNIART